MKRTIDLIAAAVGLVILSPLLLVIAVCVRLCDGHPAIFRQLRAGLQGRPFVLYKFRTMLPEINGATDEARLTPAGRLLRRFSLDELPQLWNVLRGDMSLVGPRPLFLCYLDRYTSREARRHLVKPGLTGWAQINGRNALSWSDRFDLDVWYVNHQSLCLDFHILLRSAVAVLRGRGISHSGHATMPEFMGSAQQHL